MGREPKTKTKRGKGKKKDPLKPKKALSSFMFFANAKRPELRKEDPSLKITEIGKKLGVMWKEASPEEKAVCPLISSSICPHIIS